MREVLNLIHQHGDLFYLITFVWTALEGETFVIFAALAAQRGFLNIGGLFAAAWLGSFFGDQVLFLVGRVFGTRILARFPRLKPKTDKVLKSLEKYAVVFILSYRFMYGLRNISSIAVGLSHLSWRRFAFLNFSAAFIWALAFCGAGYVFGNVIEHLGRRKNEVVVYSVRELMLTALGLFILIIVTRVVFLRRQARKVKTAGEE
ncbi:MAG: DedA family protein [Alphaproteobacteria bacterium]|nr:DedA family protein [Alphaproteobacteria bacterium]